MSEHSPFLAVFPGLSDLRSMAGGLDKAYVTDVQVDQAGRTLTVCARFSDMPSLVEVSAICRRLKADYGLNDAALVPDYPRPEPVQAPAEHRPSASGAAPTGDVLMGRAIKQRPVPMDTLSLESGKVTVEGDVVAVTSRSLQKRGSAVLCFDLTDRTKSASPAFCARTMTRAS